MLFFADQVPFATGISTLSYRPATDQDLTNRIIIPIQIEDHFTEAILDTGAPYAVCSPRVADVLQLQPDSALEQITMTIRGLRQSGYLYRLRISFMANAGINHDLEATMFVPDPIYEVSWGEHPCYIGMIGCLETIRFALDTTSNSFYFGV